MARPRTRSKIILSLLAKTALTTADIIINASLEPLRHSYKGAPTLFRGVRVSMQSDFDKLKNDYVERRKFYSILSDLKEDGLIMKVGGKTGEWKITNKGNDELRSSNQGLKSRYLKRVGKETLVISYDIPRKFNSERNWLRSQLLLLDFKLIHQSTWIGRNEISEEFLNDLRVRKIYKCVHIFSIGKTGSLKRTL